MSKQHEEILTKAIEILRKQGLKVIRLDCRTTPDAIAIDFENKTVDVVEASTSPSNIYLTKMKYERYPKQFNNEIIVTSFKPRKCKSAKAYFLALELKKKGFTERKIRAEIKKRLGEKVSNGTIHYWVSGQTRPYSVN